jgi:Family of unknown function (DUF5989)
MPNPSESWSADGGNRFSQLAEQPQRSTLYELGEFLRNNKKWWVTPIVAVLLVVAVFIVLGGTIAAPFIYTLF